MASNEDRVPYYTEEELMDYDKELPDSEYEDITGRPPSPPAPESKYGDCLATPLVEVLSVRIYSNDNDNDKDSEVYGTIQLTDGEGAVFDLYKREENDVETVRARGGSIMLNRPKGRAISPFYQVELDVDIKDKTCNSTSIAKGFVSWDYSTKHDYDEVQTEKVSGEGGHAIIHYITYRYAVIATVNLAFHPKPFQFFLSNVSEEYTPLDVYGNIVARCENSKTVNTTTSCSLFEKTLDRSVKVVYGNHMNLSRHVMAVPVHSSLVIAADLWNFDTQRQIYCNEAIFESAEHTTSNQEFYGEGENCWIKFTVQWSVLYMQPPPERNLKHRIEEAHDEENTDSKNKEKKLQLNSDHAPDSAQSSVSRDIGSHSGLTKYPIRPRLDLRVLEVFSVVISNSNKGNLDVWGTIKAQDWSGVYVLFDKEKNDAETLLGNQTAATITGPTTGDRRCIGGIWLLLGVNLKDSEGREISAGSIEWCYRRADRLPVFDKQLCSVIPGDSGYAAVHYTLISAAVQATVTIYFVTESPSSFNGFRVHGSVYTEYSDRKYVTPYEKQYYRTRLFVKRPEQPQLLASSSSHEFEVPLLKNILGVPFSSSLIVNVDLLVTQDRLPDNVGTTLCGTFQGRLSFSTLNVSRGSKIRQEIHGNRRNYITVSVEWNNVPPL